MLPWVNRFRIGIRIAGRSALVRPASAGWAEAPTGRREAPPDNRLRAQAHAGNRKRRIRRVGFATLGPPCGRCGCDACRYENLPPPVPTLPPMPTPPVEALQMKSSGTLAICTCAVAPRTPTSSTTNPADLPFMLSIGLLDHAVPHPV